MNKYNNFSLSAFVSGGIATFFKIGDVKHQVGIKIGDELMVYGKLIWDLDKKELVFLRPKYLVKNKEQLVEFLEYKLSMKQCGCILLAVFGIYHAYKFFKLQFTKKDKIQKFSL